MVIQTNLFGTELGLFGLEHGQNYLSPERRFDAALLSNPELFI